MPFYFYFAVIIAFVVLLCLLYHVFSVYRNRYWQRRHQALLAKKSAVADNIDDFKWQPLGDASDIDADEIRQYLNSRDNH